MAFAVNAYSETPFSAEPSDNTIVVSGLQITGATGSVSVTGELGVNVFPTGQSLTVTNITTIQDTLTAFGEAPFATQSPDTFSPVNIITTGTADIIPTGIELTMQENTPAVVADANVSLTGQGMTSAIGQADGFALVEVPVTGQGMTITSGTATVTADANISVTGEALTIAEGTAVLDANTIASPTGQEMTMQENAPTVVGNASVSVTGQILTTTQGSVIIDLNQQVDVTGQEMTMQEGQATATDASAEITGLSLTMSLGNTKNVLWTEISTGTTVPWKNVA